MWVKLWVDFIGDFPANPQKRMVGTRRLELLTSTVSKHPSTVSYYSLTALTASLYPVKALSGKSYWTLIGP
jgi:hypothetical protein